MRCFRTISIFLITSSYYFGHFAFAADEIKSALFHLEKINQGSVSATPVCEVEKQNFSEEACEENLGPIAADSSPNYKYFQKLLSRGASAPLEDFLKLWYPADFNKSLPDPAIFACETAPMEKLKLEVGEALPERCKPDTLYSWGSLAKMQAVSRNLADNATWPHWVNPDIPGGFIFTSGSAVSTYGYGPYLIRFKMKEGTPFVAHKYGVPPEGGVAAKIRYREFIFNESSTIDSFSYGTAEIYDEVVRDLIRYKSGQRVVSYTPPSRWLEVFQGKEPKGLDRLYAQAEDGNIQNEKTLKIALLTLIKQILNKEGRIQYSKEACRNRLRHYSTSKPSYINPNRI
ncbi:MAG: hypothetical protein AB7K68_10890 [Bacteriovoracia bacterium]